MTPATHGPAHASDGGLDARNRRVLRILLVVAAVLAVATLLAGIRW